MPKVIDNYVLEDKIGAGQFGDVFKGYHQQNRQEVAIKTIRRQTIKGKFYQLLQNQIKVLKTCDNPNIIKLYAIKKTANHFYLMLQYCNQGDMLAYVRKLGCVPEEKAIKFFCQILNAFQDLVKHKIMHRDFKLANILLHDGNIKIADFGFAKLLSNQDYATTMLGSPLNMAPEVLGGNKYNSKADIWSIGACLWQMLYGKPPYVASNMVDLLNMIKNKPLKFPPHPKIAQPLKDVLKKMLVLDSRRRISWAQLFNHPINTYLSAQLRQQINLQLVEDESLVMNTSKFYLKKNLVIQGTQDLQQKQKMNEYLYNVIKDGKKKQQFKIQQTPKSNKSNTTKQTQSIKKQQHPTNLQKTQKNKPPAKKSQIERTISKTQNQIQPNPNQPHPQNPSILQTIFRNNLKKVMHFRNIYVFLANVSDQILTPNCFNNLNISFKDSELIAYFVVHKILRMIRWLLWAIKSEKCVLQFIQNWQKFKSSKQLSQVTNYISKQLDVFTVFNSSIQPNIKQVYTTGQHSQQVKTILHNPINPAPNKPNDPQFDKLYKNKLKTYIKQISKQTIQRMLTLKKTEIFLPTLKHIEFCLIAYDTQRVFGKKQFNFMEFYDSYANRSVQQSLLRIERMIKEL